jgi:hypothetical protein
MAFIPFKEPDGALRIRSRHSPFSGMTIEPTLSLVALPFKIKVKKGSLSSQFSGLIRLNHQHSLLQSK